MTTATRTKRQPCAACKAKAHKQALASAMTKYAPRAGDGGYHTWRDVKSAGVLNKLPANSEWLGVDAEVARLWEKAQALASEWGLDVPAEVRPIVWKDDPLVEGLHMEPWPSRNMHEARSWVDPDAPWVTYLALRDRAGVKFDFNDLYESVVHEFLHRALLEAPEAFGLDTFTAVYDDRDGTCSRTVKEWAPVLANLSQATPGWQRDRLEEFKRRVVNREGPSREMRLYRELMSA